MYLHVWVRGHMLVGMRMDIYTYVCVIDLVERRNEMAEDGATRETKKLDKCWEAK